MTAFSLAISTPLGIFAAIWLVEYAHRGSKLVKVVRVTTETLQGIPSIVYGLFGMLFFVTKLHWGYSMIAGAFTLAIMVLPVIMRTTEEALIAVPDSYREGSFGLGAGKAAHGVHDRAAVRHARHFVRRHSGHGRIVGETAALIYTASSVAKIPSSVFSSTRTLAVTHVPALQRGPVHRPDLRHGSGPAGAGAGHQRPVRAGSREAGKTVKENAPALYRRGEIPYPPVGSMRQRKPRGGVKTAWRRTTSAASQQKLARSCGCLPRRANIVRSRFRHAQPWSHAYNPAPPYDSPFTGAM